jgi:hypothetical protein
MKVKAECPSRTLEVTNPHGNTTEEVVFSQCPQNLKLNSHKWAMDRILYGSEVCLDMMALFRSLLRKNYCA